MKINPRYCWECENKVRKGKRRYIHEDASVVLFSIIEALFILLSAQRAELEPELKKEWNRKKDELIYNMSNYLDEFEKRNK